MPDIKTDQKTNWKKYLLFFSVALALIAVITLIVNYIQNKNSAEFKTFLNNTFNQRNNKEYIFNQLIDIVNKIGIATCGFKWNIFDGTYFSARELGLTDKTDMEIVILVTSVIFHIKDENTKKNLLPMLFLTANSNYLNNIKIVENNVEYIGNQNNDIIFKTDKKLSIPEFRNRIFNLYSALTDKTKFIELNNQEKWNQIEPIIEKLKKPEFKDTLCAYFNKRKNNCVASSSIQNVGYFNNNGGNQDTCINTLKILTDETQDGICPAKNIFEDVPPKCTINSSTCKYNRLFGDCIDNKQTITYSLIDSVNQPSCKSEYKNQFIC